MTARAGPPTQPSPLIVVAIRDELLLRSLQSVLEPGGFRVLPAGDPASSLTQVRRRHPDGVVLDAELAHPPRFDFCRTLRADPMLSHAAPIILMRRGHPTRAEQLEALRAGAWDLRGDPLDTEDRSEEHTSELQSPCNLVCRLLLEKKKIKCLKKYMILACRSGR